MRDELKRSTLGDHLKLADEPLTRAELDDVVKTLGNEAP
jgi:hypothetical protein